MQQLRKMGSMNKMLGMLPGMGQMREAIDNFDERELDRVEAIIRSMTPAERRRPQDPQRVPPGPDRQGLRHHRDGGQPAPRAVRRGAEDDAADGRGRRHGLPGMGDLPGMGGKKTKGRRTQRKVKGRSGNPAKRAQQGARPAAARPPAGPGLGLRPGGARAEGRPRKVELPPRAGEVSSAGGLPEEVEGPPRRQRLTCAPG